MPNFLLERLLHDVLRVLRGVSRRLLLGQRLELVLDVSVVHLQRSSVVRVHVVPREHVVKLGRVVVHVQRLLVGRRMLHTHLSRRMPKRPVLDSLADANRNADEYANGYAVEYADGHADELGYADGNAV